MQNRKAVFGFIFYKRKISSPISSVSGGHIYQTELFPAKDVAF
jgi:hypothetical protein